jgi:uncharacterized protein
METLATPLSESGAGTVLRTSSYTIYVDLPDDREKVLLVHGYSGAYDVVSPRVAAYIRSLETRPAPKPLYGEWSVESNAAEPAIPDAETIDRLRRRGYLTTKDHDAEERMFARYVELLELQQRQRMPSYVIMPTYGCNLRCAYCFQDHMRTNPAYAHLLRTMSIGTADTIIASMAHIEGMRGIPAGHTKPRRVTFFGGEPLLRQSRPVVEHFVDTLRAMPGGAVFDAVTNATELEAYRDLLSPDLISDLQITIDGAPAAHDKRRIYEDGSGSFAIIARNVRMALDQGVVVSVRMNVDRSNVSSLPALARTFAEEGWTAYRNFAAYAAPVTDSGHTAGRRNELFNTWELRVALEELAHEYAEMSAFARVDDGLRMRALAILRGKVNDAPAKVHFCGAHDGMYVFDPFGDIYACWERTGDKNVRIGYVEPDGHVVLNDRRNGEWRSRNVASNPTCRKCRFALHCGGGCAVLAEGVSGTLHANYCDAFGKRFRSKIAEAYVDFTSGNVVDDPMLQRMAERQEALR